MEIRITLGDEFNSLAKGLENADELFVPFASEAVAKCLDLINDVNGPYPPQPDRMRSGHLNTYVRGQGHYPASAFVSNPALPGGFSIHRYGVKSVKMTSQQMDKKFKKTVKTTNVAVIGELRNTASYSGFVIGSKQDEPRQRGYHAETGWVSKEDAIDQAKPEMEKVYGEAVDKFVDSLAQTGA
jgi:hypothetical protein